MTRKRQERIQDFPSRTSKRRQPVKDNIPTQLNETHLAFAADRAIFGDVWRVLRGAGWTAKRPSSSSLSDLYRYIPPGGDVNGKEGTDFFLGERSLLDNYRRANAVSNNVESVNSTASFACEYPKDTPGTGAISSDIHLGSSGNLMRSSGSESDESDRVGDGAQCKLPAIACNFDSLRPESGVLVNTRLHHEEVPEAVSSGCNDSSSAVATGRSSVSSVATPAQSNVERGESACASTFGTDGETEGIATVTITDEDIVGEDTVLAIPETKCAACNTACSTSRSCTWCKRWIHHFCSHEICISLNISDGSGGILNDFGDNSYCSKNCYTSATGGEITVVVATAGREQHLFATSSGQGDAGTAMPTTSNVLSSLEKKTKRRKRTGSGLTPPPSKSKTSTNNVVPSQRKEKTPRKKSKAEVQATAMKDELLRRAHAAAERYIDANVAFSPEYESWMQKKLYQTVGSSYLMGVITRYSVQNVKLAGDVSVPSIMFHVQWTSTGFQTKDHVHRVSEEIVIRGIRQFVKMNKADLKFGESWTSLCNVIPKMSNIPALTDEFEEMDEQGYKEGAAFHGQKELHIPMNPREVEEI